METMTRCNPTSMPTKGWQIPDTNGRLGSWYSNAGADGAVLVVSVYDGSYSGGCVTSCFKADGHPRHALV